MKKTKSRVILSVFLALVISVLAAFPVQFAYAADKVSEDDPRIQELRDKIAQLDKEIAASKAKQNEIQSEMNATSATASQLQRQINEVQTELDAYNLKLGIMNNQIAELNNKITEKENSIKATENKIKEQELQIKETQKLLGERLRAMYMAGNVSKLEIILDADSFESLLNRLELVAQITKHDNQIVEELQAQIKELEKMKETLQQEMVTLEEDKKEIEVVRADVVTARNEIRSKKSELDRKMRILESHLSNLSSDSRELDAYRQQVQDEQDAYIDQIFRMLNGISSSGDGSVEGGMMWPVPYPTSHITSPYGPRSLGGGSFHAGIDISMPGANEYNKSVVAAADGIVKIVYNSCNHNYPKNNRYEDVHYSTYGNSVFIDHGNGVITLYGHLARATVSEGQRVSKGQKIGIMGCTGYSTGSHLHFEVRVNGTKVNPSNYVSAP